MLDTQILQGSQALKWRCIGPHRGGRVVAVAGHPTETMVFYFGAVAGGVWKTEDGGTYWENVSDGYFRTSAVGALTVAESDPNVIYAGTGETTIRVDVSYGDGIYKSSNAGQSWTHMGLDETRHIGEIRVHPKNPELVYVAALGHAFGPNPERGVFRSGDGGRHWEKILYRTDRAGAVDLTLDPSNPRLLYATFWEAYRNFWELSSGGPDSSLYKSIDGGDTWRDITENKGLPGGLKGKIGVAVSAVRHGRVWAIVEAEEAGLYRSDDGGDTWEQVCGNRDLIHRPWYYCHVFADPQEADTVYITNLKMWKSTNGGYSFTEVTTPHGDNHDLWIDPTDPRRMIEGNDGGACVSFNGGGTWSTIYNQPTAQFYRIDIDNRFPYRVYATQQDNSSICVPSATEYGAIPWNACYPVGTGESGFIAVHPENPDIAYIGAVGSSPGGNGVLQRYDHETKQLCLVNVWPEEYYGWAPRDLRYRFAWTYPIAFSPHDANVLYVGGNIVFRSMDEGNSWEAISPDLTRADDTKLKASGGPLNKDTSGAETYCTLSTLVESPHEPGVLWAGSDDGLIQLSRDAGTNWQNVTPPELPPWSLICVLEVSPHDPASAYFAATRYKLDDYRPFLYKTDDYGCTWRCINGDFPQNEISRVVRADPLQTGLLFAGTETGVFFSCDDGHRWQRLHNELPVTPIYDLKIKGDDLVAGTHGRSFWILDDISPLRQLPSVPEGSCLIAPRTTYRYWQHWGVGLPRSMGKNYMLGLGCAATFYEEIGNNGDLVRHYLDAGDNPPSGVLVYYVLEEPIEDPLKLTFLDNTGTEIAFFTSSSKSPNDAACNSSKLRLPAQPGLNRFVWDMRYPEAEELDQNLVQDAYDPLAPTSKSPNGPLAPPGTYRVSLTTGAATYTQPFNILKAPDVSARPEDFTAQFELWLSIRNKISAANRTINRLRRLRRQLNEWCQRAAETQDRTIGNIVSTTARELLEKVASIEIELIDARAETPSDSLRFPARLSSRLSGLISVVSASNGAPPQQAHDVFDHLSSQLDMQIARLETLTDDDVATFDELIRRVGLSALES